MVISVFPLLTFNTKLLFNVKQIDIRFTKNITSFQNVSLNINKMLVLQLLPIIQLPLTAIIIMRRLRDSKT